MNVYLAEFLGTALLILLGNGVVANVVLNRTKGHGSGWIVITAGWGFAVYVAVLCVGEVSAHINPAVSVGLAAANQFEWQLVPGYIAAQLLGAIVGAGLAHAFYKDHFDATDDPDLKLACFCTSPNIPSLPRNLFCEALGTFVLVYAVLTAADPSFQLSGSSGTTEEIHVGLGSLGALRVGLVVFAIGLCLGGTTGYAINPARDLGPRIAHALLPIAGKRDSNWGYAVIPIIGPILGAVAAAALFLSWD